MPAQRNCYVLVASLLVAFIVCGGFLFLFAQIGGLLNRARGGWVDLGPHYHTEDVNGTNVTVRTGLPYWPAHIVSRLIFAIPTGIVVLTFGNHFRAAVIVTFLTWFSLYVGWGCYMTIGTDATNYASRSGVFDWLLGRQEEGWNFTHRFVREYAGMSLRGLVWTAPQGYALQQLGFGWEYSLSGSLMGFVYYLGMETPVAEEDSNFRKPFGGGIAYSEYYWGWWIWFVLTVCCLSQLVRRLHIWIYSKNRYLGFKPFSTWEIMKYQSLNRTVPRAAYELFMVALNIIFSGSVVYYSLVEQQDIRNKGQTFFGIFTGTLFLALVQGWVWSLIYLRWKRWRAMKRFQERQPYVRPHSPTYGPRSSPRDNDHDHLDAAAAANHSGETQPLLSWPYSHPDHSPHVERRTTLTLPEGNPNASSSDYTSRPQVTYREQTSTTVAFLELWPNVEMWVWVDIFIWLRRLIGMISLLSTIVTIVMTVIATVWDWHSPRFYAVPTSIIPVSTL